MGKATKTRQRAAAEKDAAFLADFNDRSRKAREPEPDRPLIEEFLGFEGDFTRPPDGFVLKTRSGNRSKQTLEMARYLFARFRVPRILDQCWQAYSPGTEDMSVAARRWHATQEPQGQHPVRRLNPNLEQHDFRRWYIAAGTGASIHKTCAGGKLTKRETHLFLSCPHPITLQEALVHALARAQGANDGIALRLARSRLSEKPLDGFWGDVVRFFSQPGHAPASVAATGDLADFLQDQHLRQSGYSLFGRGNTLASLQRRAEEWHRALTRAKIIGNVQWEGCGLPDYRVVTAQAGGPDTTWVLRQITDARTLASEGTAMRHCVLGYRHRCVQGACSIWSLAIEGPDGEIQRKVTIELSDTGRIVQKRGLANRATRPQEDHVISRWARSFGLDDSGMW